MTGNCQNEYGCSYGGDQAQANRTVRGIKNGT